MAYSVLVPLAEGFEEIEMIVPVDMFRRAGWNVVTASIGQVSLTATRQTHHLADSEWGEASQQEYDIVYLPGGQPGATHLLQFPPLLDYLQNHYQKGGWLAAICAAPLILIEAGIIDEKTPFTLHPAHRQDAKDYAWTEERVVVHQKLITGMAAGIAPELTFRIFNEITGNQELSESVNAGLHFPKGFIS
ncbi:MAG: DJ-1/PfpI family protein [Verrucomicrobiota bacterium]